jgi:hypothetical protein
MKKFKEGDEIVRTRDGHVWAPIGYRSIVLRGYFYIDALGKSSNQVTDEFWELAEDTSKPVTEEYEGNVYEIGGLYNFSTDSTVYRQLLGIKANSEYPFIVNGNCFSSIQEISAILGTITPAPIELIDGNAYMFDFGVVGNRVGVYDNSSGKFIYPAGYVSAANCTNIRPMTVAESK